MLTFGAPFCGCGGATYGLERAGMRCVWAFDFDADAVATHARNCGGRTWQADVRDVNGYDLEDVDLIVGGPPCQPFSAAGKQLGDADARNMLPHFMRLCVLKRPRWVLMENVPQVRHAESYRRLKRALERGGYRTTDGLLNAMYYGVPQRRKRWFLVATRELIERMPWPAMTTPGGLLGARPTAVREALGIRAAICDGVAPTISASQGRGGYKIDGGSGSRASWRRLGIDSRRLTPEDGALLMGFGQTFSFVGRPKSIGQQVGNAVPPPVAEAWGRAIVAAHHDARTDG